MDPLSVTASVAGIATACLLTAKTLNNLRSKFQDAQMTIAAICAETTVIGTTLAKIQGILLNNPHVLTAEIHDAPGLEIQATFDIALTGCTVIYSCLDIEVQKLKQYANGSEQPDWTTKAKVYWKDDTMKELLGNLRGQQGAISLLISVLQIETTADIHRILKEKEKIDVLESTAGRTRSLRALYPQSKAPESIFDADKADGYAGDTASVVGSSIFGFDDKLVDSNVYRRTLKAAWQRSSKSKNDLAKNNSDNETIGDQTLTSRNKSQAPSSTSSKQNVSNSSLALRRCDESVMGLWATGTVRRYRALEFRFEVLFQTPVIFLSSPSNLDVPFSNRETYYIDGTEESYRDTLLPWNADFPFTKIPPSARGQRTDDTLVSWIQLLTTVQESERLSRAWDVTDGRISYISRPEYQLAVGLQRKSNSWDFMPSNINKPYASTDVSSLVEIVAFLGMAWSSFNDDTWEMRAEGNGHALTSTKVEGLGVMVYFWNTGYSNQTERRVIPNYDAIKALPFGEVPSLLKGYVLQFGAPDSVRSLLQRLGCSVGTVKHWEGNHKHLFSLEFEIIALLGNVFRLPGSNFRMLPNPTRDRWNGTTRSPSGHWKLWNTKLILDCFVEIESVKTAKWNEVSGHLSAPLMKSTWNAIKLSLTRNSNDKDEFEDMTTSAREKIHDSIIRITKYLELRHDFVLEVVAVHLDVVMGMLQDPDSLLATISRLPAEEMSQAFSHEYFDVVRPRVVDTKDKKGNSSHVDRTVPREYREYIWCALMFRMLLWFTIHDFNENDINMVPRHHKGSKVPIFIG